MLVVYPRGADGRPFRSVPRKTERKDDTMKPMKQVFAAVLACLLVLSAGVVQASAASSPFADVPASHWACQDILAAKEKGFVDGVGGSRFAPEGTVTYAQFVTMLVRACGNAPSAGQGGALWYLPYMQAAEKAGLLTGTKVASSDTWNTTCVQAINRYEMALLLNNVLTAKQIAAANLDQDAIASQITDAAQIPAAYRQAVFTCYHHGILNGMEDDAFAGSASMTRAQACAVLMRMDRLLTTASWEQEVFLLVNQIRQDYGLPAFVYDPTLAAVARAHSQDMIDRNFFSHQNPDGASPADRISAAGIRWRQCAENIAAGYPSPEAVVAGWMASPGHRANILGSCQRLGVGLAVGGSYQYYWTQCFATY